MRTIYNIAMRMILLASLCWDGAGALELPDPLLGPNGLPLTTVEQWESVGCPAVLEAFQSQVYGRVPETPFEQRVEKKLLATETGIILRLDTVTISNKRGELPITMVLALPPSVANTPSPLIIMPWKLGRRV